jgi:hypothetical protein
MKYLLVIESSFLLCDFCEMSNTLKNKSQIYPFFPSLAFEDLSSFVCSLKLFDSSNL